MTKTNTAKVIFIGLLMISIALTTQKIINMKESENTFTLDACYEKAYNDITELIQDDNDLIIYGKVIESNTYLEWLGGNIRSIIVTNYTVEIKESLKGTVKGTVIVHKLGGELDGRKMSNPEDPFLTVGEEYIMFLKLTPTGHYALRGGPQGRFVVQNNVVYSLGEYNNSQKIQAVTSNLDLNGITLNQFLNQIKGNLSK
jgi:hypothetical protein